MTSAPFVTGLRTNGAVLELASGDEPVLHIRVQVMDLWDSVRVDAPPTEPVLSVKGAALAAQYPDGAETDDYVVRLHGFEILDETQSLAAAGVRDGSILLLVARRRRPVR
ncbi:MAG TPA: hypothetical protein VES88_11140 [Gemmatimonadaceae bacterium]|nr:hypothetical protein [Gemmatimonadaceae bacterium]